ncbi:MAG: MFS transporter [Chloroflexi bacterium]|nr:MFS transporter [Chloroflexota bacterium]
MQWVASLAALRRSRALYALGFPEFRRLWFGGVLDGLANWMERLAVGWLVLAETGSVFLAALSFAVRAAPHIVFGPFGGAVADRFERSRVLSTTASAKAALIGAIAVVVLAGWPPTWPVLALVALTGVARASETPATQALITDIVGGRRAANAIGLHSFGVRAMGMLGALGGGVLIDFAGAGIVFAIAAASLVAAAVVYASIRAPRARPATLATPSLLADAIAGLRAVIGIPVVAALLALAMGVEVLGFSYQSLMPAVAERVLRIDAAGLGTLTLFAGVGAIAGTAALSLLGESTPRGPLLIAVTLGFGAALIAFGQSERFVLSLLLVAAVGAMAAMFDALQWVLLQASVPDEMRGRVIGGWMSAIGFGWLGPIALGALAEAAGTRWALVGSGSLVIALAVAAALLRGVRRL